MVTLLTLPRVFQLHTYTEEGEHNLLTSTPEKTWNFMTTNLFLVECTLQIVFSIEFGHVTSSFRHQFFYVVVCQ